ncbi:MAG: DUF1993 domain-containing protein [Janthinobacterium lividum]
MTLSMYQASVPVFVRQFASLTAILDKAEASAAERGIDPAQLLEARLAPDMHPLTRQVQIASDAVKGGIARLAGVEMPSFADTETSFAELKERIAKTVAFIESIPADKVDGSEERAITLKIADREMTFPGQTFLLGFVLPNFFFHVSIAYALLRSQGVELGKRDYLGG